MNQPNIIKRQKNVQLLLLFAFILGLTIWSMWDIGFDVISLAKGIGETFRFIFVDMFPPDLSSILSLLQPALDTIYMSFVAMVIAAILAFFLSFLVRSITTPLRLSKKL